MQILLTPVTIATAIAINSAGCYEIQTPINQQIVLCVIEMVQLLFSSTHFIIFSVTTTGLDDNENRRSVSPYWEQPLKTDALLDSIHSESRWTLHISRPTSNLQAFRAQEHKSNYIIIIWKSQSNRTATENITSHLQALQDAGLLSNKSLFLTDICSRVSQPPHDFALRVFEDLWHSFKIIDVTLVIPYSSTAETYTSALRSVQVSSTEAVELYTLNPLLASATCGNVVALTSSTSGWSRIVKAS
jgi:hypothetical protein